MRARRRSAPGSASSRSAYPRGAPVRRRERAEPAGVLATAVPRREPALRRGVRPVPRGRLRRAQGRRPDDHRRRCRPLAARQRPAARAEQRLDLARPVPRRARRVVPDERARPAADGRPQLPPVPERGDRPARARLSVAERRLRQPRPGQAGALGRVRRHRPADDARRAPALSRRGRLAGRHERAVDGYTGSENVPVTTRRTQAAVYGELVRRAACDPDVAEVNIFGFRDDALRDGLPGGPAPRRRHAAAAAAPCGAALAATSCPRSATPGGDPARAVVGATAPVVRSPRTARRRLTAAEGATARACLLAGSHTLSSARRLLSSRASVRHGEPARREPCGRSRRTTLTPRRARRGRATLAVRARREANAARHDDDWSSGSSAAEHLTPNTCSVTMGTRCSPRRSSSGSSSSRSPCSLLWALFAGETGAGGPERAVPRAAGRHALVDRGADVRRRPARGRLGAPRAQRARLGR